MASQKKYDFIFTGFGASSCILVHEMHKKGMLENKSILVLDPSAKKANDKTYCFWANKDSEIVKDYGSLISHNWPKIAIDDGIAQDIGQLNYFHINSLDLYEASKALLMSYDTTFALETVNVITHTGEPHVKTDSGEYIGDSVFDARPPEMNQKLLSDQNILQSFVGYKVQLKNFKLKKDTCTLMDFKVAQQGYTQFVYVLPYSKDSALIELTRFGKAPISREESKGILENYILEKYGDYELLEIEKGVIPMFMELPKLEKIKGVIPIGTRANKVKPSTGYAFKNMHEHAKSLCSSVKVTKTANRFRVYDRLLILILALWPEKGKPLFQQLFRAKNTAYVLRFLDEKTSIWEDLKMFYKLPIGLFLKACFVLGLKKSKSALILFTPILLFFIIDLFNPDAAINAIYFILLLGLILVGIPHGAMDHMTEAFSKTKKVTFAFLFKYLGLMTVVYLLWVMSPTTALVSFLIYSAWHFGETDAEEWGIKSPLTGILWGSLFFVGLFSSHVKELNTVLTLLDVASLSSSVSFGYYFWSSILISLGLARYFKSVRMLTLVAFLFVSQWLPLVVAFGIYFIFHHSYNGWGHLKSSLGKSNLYLFKNALPFNLGAFALFLFFFLNPEASIEGNISFFFVFISCISFPHIFCMHRFYALRRKT